MMVTTTANLVAFKQLETRYLSMIERHSPAAAQRLSLLDTAYDPQVVCTCASLLLDFWYYHCQPDFALDLCYYAEFCAAFPSAMDDLTAIWMIFQQEARQRYSYSPP